MKNHIYTIGYAGYDIDSFILTLQKNNIGAVADIRTSPYSKYYHNFSRDSLKCNLSTSGIKYVFLGKELGARSGNVQNYKNGKVSYELLAQDPLFLEGIERIYRGVVSFSIALMCSEKDPIECHRSLLVGRKLNDSGLAVTHILSTDRMESHTELEKRLLDSFGFPEGDMFTSKLEFLNKAYVLQVDKVAYLDEDLLKIEKDMAA